MISLIGDICDVRARLHSWRMDHSVVLFMDPSSRVPCRQVWTMTLRDLGTGEGVFTLHSITPLRARDYQDTSNLCVEE